MKRNKKGLEFFCIFLTIVMGYVAHVLFIAKYWEVRDDVYEYLLSRFRDLGVVESKTKALLLVVYFFGYLLLIAVTFLINKFILFLCKRKIPDVKLLMSVGTSYAVCCLLGSFMIGYVPDIAMSIINVVADATIILIMCGSDLKKKIPVFVTLKAVVALINIVVLSTNFGMYYG